MARFIAQRVLHGLLVVLAVSVVVFGLSFLTGDPASLLLPPEASQADLEAFRASHGLDRPIPVQYLDFLSGIVTGDFGDSIVQGEDAMSLVLERLPESLVLAAVSLVVSWLVAIPLGLLSALRRGSWMDQVGKVVAILGQCVPNFFLGIVLILFFAVKWRLLPATGSLSVKGLILPAVTLGLFAAAETMRLLRSSLLEVLGKDFIRTARAKGASERRVILRHAFKNAAIPVTTVLGLQVNTLIGRAVIVETVFSYPGMGLLAYRAIGSRDFIVLQAFVIVMAALVVTLNLLVDLLYVWIDPRIKHQPMRRRAEAI